MKTSMAAVSCAILVLLASCGSDSPTSGTDAASLPTATTSTAAPVPTSSAPSSTMMATTVPPTEVTTPPTESREPETTDPATTDSTAGTTPSSESTGTTGGDGSGEYATVASPTLPPRTLPVTLNDSHPDGVYYASISEGGDPEPAEGSVVFEVVQLFTGQECIDHFGDEDEDACVNDYGVETDPTSYVEVPLDGLYISVVDAATQQSYRISGDELAELLVGGDPSASAPADYLYSGFGYLLTYEGGQVTRAEQWWTP